MTNKSILEGWEKVYTKKVCAKGEEWGVTWALTPFAGALLRYSRNYIKRLLKAQREKDKERLLEGIKTLQPKVSLFRDAGKTTAKIYAMAIEDIKQLINKIYE